MYIKSDDNGSTWGSPFELVNVFGLSACHITPSVVACGGEYDVHVVWSDSRDTVSLERYYKRHHRASVEEEVADLEFQISFSYIPNGVRFSIYLPHSSLVELKVYDVSGRLVDKREFVVHEGNNEFSWHRDRSGLYFFRFKIDGSKILEKAIIF